MAKTELSDEDALTIELLKVGRSPPIEPHPRPLSYEERSMLPLSKGEGWGEGEECELSTKSCKNARKLTYSMYQNDFQ